MAKDIDYFVDNSSFEDNVKLLGKDFSQKSFGFHISASSGEWFDYLDSTLKDGDELPLQIMSGPAMTLRYFSALPEKLVSMVKLKKVVLCVHLPFVVTFYKPYAQLLYQRQAFQELSSYYKKLEILDKVFVLAHCGHPILDPEGNANVQWGYWREIAVQNILSSHTYFPNFLIENLAGSLSEPLPFTDPDFIYNELLKHPDLVNKPGLALALDTEHLFASGKSLKELGTETLKRVRFIHCNASPSSVLFGKRLDLHSYTQIQSSIEGGYGPFSQPGSTIQDYFDLGLNNIPAVFERKNMSTQIKDLNFLLSYIKMR